MADNMVDELNASFSEISHEGQDDNDDVDFADDGKPKATTTADGLSTDLPKQLSLNNQHRTYLVTYSDADLGKFPTREAYARAVVGAFGGNMVDYYVCGMEPHQSGAPHYHLAIRLSRSARWFYAKKSIQEQYGVVLNFSEPPGGGYYSRAFAYVTKQDENAKKGGVLMQHPPVEKLQTQATCGAAKANAVYREKRKAANAQTKDNNKGTKKKEKTKRLGKYDVVMVIRKNKLKTDNELLAFSERRVDAGNDDLARYLTQLGERTRQELLKDAWKMASSIEQVAEAKKSRLELLREFAGDENKCVCHGGVWLVLALDLLDKNNIPMQEFAERMYRAMVVGRQKHVNVMLIGPSNCGKTFLMEPLNIVFGSKVFNTPASSMFGWRGLEECDIIYLNDFRWVNPITNPKVGIIVWDAFLRLLEGANCSLPAPMNTCAKHIELTPQNDMPIFCTGLDEIRYFENNTQEPQTQKHVLENEMMQERWINPVFRLNHRFDQEHKVLCEPCGHCFAQLVLKGRPRGTDV